MLFLSVFSSARGQQSETMEDFDFLTSFTEENYAAFPVIMELGYKKQYEALKKRLRKQVSKGEIGIERVACEYAIWFHKNFDSHYSVVTPLWRTYWRTAHTDYSKVMEEYAPKPVSCKVDEQTWLMRIPSCIGNNPTMEWVAEAVEQYMESGCENLIIDVRGNGGGTDEIWSPFISMLVDHKRECEFESLFRNTPFNRKFLEEALEDDDFDLRDFLEQCKNNNNDFELWYSWDGSGITPTSLPKQVGVIVDNMTASSGECIIGQYAKGVSHRTKVYGKERTYGANLTGNCRESKLPHSDIYIFYSTCIQSLDFRKNVSFGKIGIEPDVYIDIPYPNRLTDRIDEWVLWVAKDLKKTKKKE